MRAQFSVLKPYRLYRNLTVIFDTKMKQFENAFIVLSPTKNSTIAIMQSPLFQQNYIRGFYLDKFLDKTLYRKLIETDRMNVYKEIKGATNVTVCPLNNSILKNKNTYYPTWPELNAIFSIPGAHNKVANAKNFISTMRIVQNKIQSRLYKHQYVIIDSELFGSDFGDSESSWIKGMSIGSMLYLHWREIVNTKRYNEFIFAGKRVIIYDKRNKVAFAIPENTEKLSLGKLKWMLRLTHKLAIGEQLTEEDLAEGEIVANPVAGQKACFISTDNKEEINLKNILVNRDFTTALSDYIQANYPEADAIVEDKQVTIEATENSMELIAQLKSGKINVFASEINLLDERVFKKVGNKFKLAKDAKFVRKASLTIEKSGDSVLGIKFVINKSEEKASINKAKIDALKNIEGLKNAIPLSAEEKEMLFDINDRIEEIFNETDNEEEAADKVRNDPLVAKKQNELTASRLTGVQNKKSAEVVAKLNEKQNEAIITVNGKNEKLSEKLQALKASALEPFEFKTNAINPEMHTSSMKAMRRTYMRDLYESDQYRIFTQFSESKDIPIFVEAIEREDTSNPLNEKETLTIHFNIAGERPKSMSIDIPKIDNDGFMYLQGNKKQFTNQITMMPIAKVMQSGELVVQYNTSYNKIFLSRSTGNFSREYASFIKAINKMTEDKKNSGTGYNFTLGICSTGNSGKKTSLEYFELAKKVFSVRIKDVSIFMSQDALAKEYDKASIDLAEYEDKFPSADFFPIGIMGKNIPIFAGMTDGIFIPSLDGGEPSRIGETISGFIPGKAKELPEVYDYFLNNVYSGTSFTYTKLEVVNSYIPLLVFLGFKDGIEPLFEKYDIEYKFVPKDVTREITVPEGYDEKVAFKDGIMWYKSGTIKKDLLFNGIYKLPTKDFNLSDFAAEGEGYYQYFIDEITPRYGKALQNFYTLFIDPITSDILKDNDIPNDITGSFLYCNDLLQDSNFLERYDMTLYRIRNIECMNAMLYKLVAKQIEKYRRGSRGDTAGILAVRSDALIQEMNNSPIVEDATLLDPIKEAENFSKAVYKGPGAPAYQHAQGTQDLRFFDDSQRGVLGIGSSFDGNSGMNRRIALNSLITSKRGYVKANVSTEQLDATNLYSLGELTATFTTRHSDPPRMMMTVGQSGHQIPTGNMQTPMISSGAYKILPHFIGNDFVFKAALDGKVESYDKQLNALHIRYNDGSRGVVELGVRHRRSPDGFFISIQQETKLKPGDTFKQDDILAADKHFFNLDGNNTEMKQGTVCKLAMIGRDCTIEDSSAVTRKFANKLFSTIVMQTSLLLSKTSNLLKIVKIGDNVKTSDPLAIFEENLEDKSITDALSKFDSLKDAMQEMASNMKSAKYTGKIVDIEVYYNHDLSEYSTSLRQFIEAYIKSNQHRSSELSKGINKGQFVEQRELDIIKTGRAKGVPFDGVLINFYTELEEPFAIGNKITWDTALKSVVGEIIPEGKEPISEYRPEELIDGVMSPLSMLNRKCSDFFYRAYTQKVLMELKFQVKEIAEGKR